MAWVQIALPPEAGEGTYYWNRSTGKVQWESPPAGEEVWRREPSEYGIYWWNTRTMETTWGIPSFADPEGPIKRRSSLSGDMMPEHPMAPAPLPPDSWVKVWAERPYFWNFQANLTMWQAPEAGWQWELQRSDEDEWYIDTQTNTVHRELPPLTELHGPPLRPEEVEAKPPEIGLGAGVIIRGLKEDRIFNNQAGHVLDWVNHDGEHHADVQLPDPLGGTVLRVKPSHLATLPDGTAVRVILSAAAGQQRFDGVVKGEYDKDSGQYTVELIGPWEGIAVKAKPNELRPCGSVSSIDLTMGGEPLRWRDEQVCKFIDRQGRMHRFHIRLPGELKKLEHGQRRQFPVLIFLHGAGGNRGCTGGPFFGWSRKSTKTPGMQEIAKKFTVVSPHCEWDWKDTPELWIDELARYLRCAEYVDERRIYLAGCSMGGMGTYEVATRLPNMFAGVAPMASYHKAHLRGFIAEKLSAVPVHVVHSMEDTTCPHKNEMPLWDLLKHRNQKFMLTLLECDHLHVLSRCCEQKMEGGWLYDWFLSHWLEFVVPDGKPLPMANVVADLRAGQGV